MRSQCQTSPRNWRSIRICRVCCVHIVAAFNVLYEASGTFFRKLSESGQQLTASIQVLGFTGLRICDVLNMMKARLNVFEKTFGLCEHKRTSTWQTTRLSTIQKATDFS